MNIGLLNPGAMGVSVGASVKAGGHRVLWASEDRGAATRARAVEHGLEDVGTVGELCAASDIILSVCPPAAAEDVAHAVAATAFPNPRGTTSPATIRITAAMPVTRHESTSTAAKRLPSPAGTRTIGTCSGVRMTAAAPSPTASEAMPSRVADDVVIASAHPPPA